MHFLNIQTLNWQATFHSRASKDSLRDTYLLINYEQWKVDEAMKNIYLG